jgi:hypothetical protein
MRCPTVVSVCGKHKASRAESTMSALSLETEPTLAGHLLGFSGHSALTYLGFPRSLQMHTFTLVLPL